MKSFLPAHKPQIFLYSQKQCWGKGHYTGLRVPVSKLLEKKLLNTWAINSFWLSPWILLGHRTQSVELCLENPVYIQDAQLVRIPYFLRRGMWVGTATSSISLCDSTRKLWGQKCTWFHLLLYLVPEAKLNICSPWTGPKTFGLLPSHSWLVPHLWTIPQEHQPNLILRSRKESLILSFRRLQCCHTLDRLSSHTSLL